ncbi:MAG: glycosyltransferase family 4 protein [Rhodospirillales bacterium]
MGAASVGADRRVEPGAETTVRRGFPSRLAGSSSGDSMSGRTGNGTRVLFLTQTPEFFGGAENSLLDLLANPGVDAVLAAPGEGPLTAAAGALGVRTRTFALGAVERVVRPPRPATLIRALCDGVRAASQIRWIARDCGAQVVHSNGLKVHVLACMARLLGGPPVVVHVRDVPFTAVEKAVWRLLAAIASRLFLVSRACWPWRRLPGHVRIIHNGIATPTGPLPARPLSWPVTVGFVGRLHPFKGLHLMVDWLAEARRQGLDLRLIVRGKARDGEEDYVTAVRATVAARGLEAYCRFEGQCNGLERVYAGLDIVAVPSSVPDPLPRAVMEALGLGIPVIGYPAGGIPDMIRDRETGYLAATAEEFVAAVRHLTASQADYDRIRAAARRWVSEALTLDALYANVNRQYAEIRNSGA